jgi:hypothetical protein
MYKKSEVLYQASTCSYTSIDAIWVVTTRFSFDIGVDALTIITNLVCHILAIIIEVDILRCRGYMFVQQKASQNEAVDFFIERAGGAGSG